MKADARILLAGHRGMVGSAILQALRQQGYRNLLCAGRDELDFCEQAQVRQYFAANRPEYVFLAAAKVGGIVANQSYPADFVYINTIIAANVIDAAYRCGVKKLLNLGSSCIYPAEAAQPLRESALLSGPLEPSNAPYATAKIAAIALCRAYNAQYQCNFLSAMPCNLYGPNDNFHLQHSHLLPALVRKMAEAKDCGRDEVVLWGDGSPRRELLYSADLAEAALFLMKRCDAQDIDGLINIGSGKDIEIRQLAQIVAQIVGYRGELRWDRSYPNGTMRKLLDCSQIQALGWQPRVSLEEGVTRLLAAYRSGNYRQQ